MRIGKSWRQSQISLSIRSGLRDTSDELAGDTPGASKHTFKLPSITVNVMTKKQSCMTPLRCTAREHTALDQREAN